MEIKVVLEPQEEGGFTVYAPSLPGCVSQGDTKAEALKNIKEAIEIYSDGLMARSRSEQEYSPLKS